MLRAGFSSRCITPSPGKEIPGLFERRFAQGVHDDLYARAAVIEEDARTVAVVQVDTIVLPEEVVAEARKEVQRLCGIPTKHCFLAATHTHSGGPICDLLTAEGEPEYQRFVAQQIAAAVFEARRRMEPVFWGVDRELARGVAFNRRFVMQDGSHKTHPGKMNAGILSPAGPEDPTVLALTFYEPEHCRPVGCLVNFACHATHMNGVLFSADYIKWVIDTLQSALGPSFGVVFLNGACGDVTQVDNRSERPMEMGAYWAERTGRVVAGAALQAIVRANPCREATLGIRTSNLRAAIRRSTPEMIRQAQACLSKSPVVGSNVDAVFARELLTVERMRRKTPTRVLELSAFRVGDAVFWGVPGELFQSFALAVRDQSPFAYTGCVELANGYNGYICTPEAFAGGGYEVRTARSSILEPDTGANVVKTVSRMLIDLYKQAQSEIEQIPRYYVWPVGDASPLRGLQELAAKKTRSSE